MKFPGFKEFTQNTAEAVLQFIKTDLSSNFRELSNGLKKLDFLNNFESFIVTVEIPAGQEVAIENKLRDSIPTKRFIVRSNSYQITDGVSEWSKQYIYLQNAGASTATATVLFLK